MCNPASDDSQLKNIDPKLLEKYKQTFTPNDWPAELPGYKPLVMQLYSINQNISQLISLGVDAFMKDILPSKNNYSSVHNLMQ